MAINLILAPWCAPHRWTPPFRHRPSPGGPTFLLTPIPRHNALLPSPCLGDFSVSCPFLLYFRWLWCKIFGQFFHSRPTSSISFSSHLETQEAWPLSFSEAETAPPRTPPLVSASGPFQWRASPLLVRPGAASAHSWCCVSRFSVPFWRSHSYKCSYGNLSGDLEPTCKFLGPEVQWPWWCPRFSWCRREHCNMWQIHREYIQFLVRERRKIMP